MDRRETSPQPRILGTGCAYAPDARAEAVARVIRIPAGQQHSVGAFGDYPLPGFKPRDNLNPARGPHSSAHGAALEGFAAVLDDRVTSVTLKNGPTSFREWAGTPIVHWPSANFLSQVLRHVDVDDCIRMLGDRVTVIAPWGPRMEPV